MNPFRAWLLHPRAYGAALLHFDWLDSAGELMMTSTGCALGAAERSGDPTRGRCHLCSAAAQGADRQAMIETGV